MFHEHFGNAPSSSKTSTLSFMNQILLSQLTVNFTKYMHISFKSSFNTRYFISNIEINSQETQKDLGVIVSSDLKWSNHYNSIIPKVYKSLALIRCTFSPSNCPSVKLHLYITLVCPNLTYCSQLWQQYLIMWLEHIQHRVTKFILNNFTSATKPDF